MKHTITHTIALFVLFSASVAFAADSAYMATTCHVLTEDDMLYRVIYQSAKEDNVTIQLFDETQQLVYTEQVRSSAFTKKYDLSYLPYGDYELKVKSKDYSFSEELKLGDLSSFQFNMDQRSDRKVVLVGNKIAGKDMTLYILDQEKEVVYKEYFDDASQVHKNYNFEAMRAKKVTFLLYHKDLLITEKEFVF